MSVTWADYAAADVRGYEVRDALSFHADQRDAVALLCLAKSRQGGLSRIASSVAMHNTILARRPDLAAELGRNFCWSRSGEIPEGQGPWHESPVFNFVDGMFSAVCGYVHILKGHAYAGAPDISPLQLEALDMAFEPGDIQILNNSVIVHGRSAYDDWPEASRRRHLWRLWMTVPGLRPRAPYFENYEGGVCLTATRNRIVLEPGEDD